jgi:hypothetical protein
MGSRGRWPLHYKRRAPRRRRLDQTQALNRWTKTCLENLPPVRRRRPNEIIVRRAVRRLLRVWKRHSKLRPTARGPFSRFTEATLRQPLEGYWPEERKLVNPIKDVLKEEKSRQHAD